MHDKVAEWYNYYHSINTFVPLRFILQSSEFINHGFISLTDTESNTDITYQNYTSKNFHTQNPKEGFSTPEDGTARLSQNISKKVPLLAAY